VLEFGLSALRQALGLGDVRWLSTPDHTSFTVFEPDIARPDVAVVVLAIRWSNHDYAEVQRYCDKYSKPLVRLRAGYNPNQVAHQLLAQAGGVTAIGADALILMGTRHGAAFRQQVDLVSLFDAEDRQQDPILENGDVVFVDRAPVVYLYGEVQRPGPVRLERQMTVLQALAASGGPTPRGTTRGLKVTRRAPNGALTSWVPELSAPLRSGDVLHVPESLF
jgi:hypothetical protein